MRCPAGAQDARWGCALRNLSSPPAGHLTTIEKDYEMIQNIERLISDIVQHCKDATHIKQTAEKKDELLQVIAGIQYSALILARRTINDEVHCDFDMLRSYCDSVLTALVKAEEAQDGRCMRCYERSEDLTLAGGEIVCPACAAEK